MQRQSQHRQKKVARLNVKTLQPVQRIDSDLSASAKFSTNLESNQFADCDTKTWFYLHLLLRKKNVFFTRISIFAIKMPYLCTSTTSISVFRQEFAIRKLPFVESRTRRICLSSNSRRKETALIEKKLSFRVWQKEFCLFPTEQSRFIFHALLSFIHR